MAFFDNGEYTVHGHGEEVVDKWIVEPELELATPEVARRRDALRREAEALELEIETRDARRRARGVRAGDRRRQRRPSTPLQPLRFEAQSGARLERLAGRLAPRRRASSKTRTATR